MMLRAKNVNIPKPGRFNAVMFFRFDGSPMRRQNDVRKTSIMVEAFSMPRKASWFLKSITVVLMGVPVFIVEGNRLIMSKT